MDDKTIEINGEKVTYLEIDGGKPIVFLHGVSGSRFSWEKTISFLPEKYRAISVDLPLNGKKISFDELSQWLKNFIKTVSLKKLFLSVIRWAV
jgi:pimeloyl-ACP methyl ester carboxylesterase